MQLLDYEFQNIAVTEIVAAAKKLLARNTAGAILLDAPTGAGKTVTAAIAIAALSDSYPEPLAFIWLAPNTLHEQSRDSLVSIYRENRSLSCLTPDELRGGEIEDRSILFMNWSSVNKADNRLRRDDDGTETGRTLQELLNSTRALGRKIVLIVDESHRDVNGVQAQLVVKNIIAPDLTLEISATPVLKDYDLRVTILREDVVSAGVIRKQFVINPGVESNLSIVGDTVRIDDAGSAELILDVALGHRLKLKEAYANVGARVNPLLLIQLPDKGDGPTDVRERIEDHLQRVHGVSMENGKAAIWLANEKRNLEHIEAVDSAVEVLFFKQAIALGWDCPRAHILVSLREMKSPTFTSQVLGRILRQPEHRHYDDPLLDSAYVFTNYHQFTLEKQFESVMATRLVTAQHNVTFPLPYWREVNADQRLYLTESAYRGILQHAESRIGQIAYRGHVTGAMVSDLAVENIDVEGEMRRLVYAGEVAYELGEVQLEQMLTLRVRAFTAKTAAQVDGRKHIRRALLELAKRVLPSASEKELREIVLHQGNKEAIELTVEAAISQLTAEFSGKTRAFAMEDQWRPQDNKVMRWSKSLDGFSKCVYAPSLDGEFDSSEEVQFARHLDGHSDVVAWLKNGTQTSEHFAIPYEMDGKPRLFFPDFLAVFSDGSFGIWDTKGHGVGGSANYAETTFKAEALAAYRTARLAEGCTVCGGIVVLNNNGRWTLNDAAQYAWSENLAGWRPFAESLSLQSCATAKGE